MRRKSFDTLISSAGLLMAVVLLVAGGLLTWASVFIGDQVHDQLAAQKIFFPAEGSAAVKGPEFADMRKYGGQELTTGAQAETYADHFIAVHLSEVAAGKTYAEVSAALQADPANKTLQAQADTLFKGNTLRGLLLNAYAFGRMSSIAMIAAAMSFFAAALMLLLSLLGFWHSRRVSAEVALPGSPEPAAVRV
jgi:hypothetical protein